MKSLEKTEKEEFSVAMTHTLNSLLRRHLIRTDMQEDVAFALYKPSAGSKRFTSLLYKVILPEKGDRIIHGNVDIAPEYFRKVVRMAVAENSGLALLHSHPSKGWQGMSYDDILTEEGYSVPHLSLTEMPFVGLTLSQDGVWSARVWEYNNGWFDKKSASTVRVVGKRLEVSFNDTIRPKPGFKEIYKRTVTVWGEKNHGQLARLRIGIIGLGSVGSIVNESLARIGVERVTLIDFDEVQEHNLDRLLGATSKDINALKVHVAHRQFQKSATASFTDIDICDAAVTEEKGYLAALDCDVLFSCVDRPWPRHVLNHISYNHLIPVIDGGIKVRLNPKTKEFEGADWQLQTATVGRACLQCMGAYNQADVSTEREGLLESPSYLDGLPFESNFKRNENVFPFSLNLASLEVLQLVEMVTGIGCDGEYDAQRYAYNQGIVRLMDPQQCINGCLFQEAIASGDTLIPAPIGFDHSVKDAKARQIF